MIYLQCANALGQGWMLDCAQANIGCDQLGCQTHHHFEEVKNNNKNKSRLLNGYTLDISNKLKECKLSPLCTQRLHVWPTHQPRLVSTGTFSHLLKITIKTNKDLCSG